jgi:ABC-type multidrug transport system fused ATPase/permease subunit
MLLASKSRSELQPQPLPVWWVSYLVRTEFRLFLQSAVCKLMWSASALSCAYYFVQTLVATRDVTFGLSICFAYLAVMIVLSFFAQYLGYLSGQLGSRAKARLAALVAEHALLHAAASEKNLSMALTLASSDAHLVCDGAVMIHYLWAAPVEATAIVALLINFSRDGGWICAGVALATILILYTLSLIMTRIRGRFNAVQSEQVSLFFEVLQNIRSFRFYGWDAVFLRKLHSLTDRMEMFLLQLGSYKSFNLILVSALSQLLGIVMFGILTKQIGALTAELAFTALSLFNTLRFPLVVLPNAARACSAASAAYTRIRDFLNSDKAADHRLQSHTAGCVEMENLPVGPNGSILEKWAASPGELWIFEGPVRSYKTTLIETIAGHYPIPPSAIVRVGGRVSYAMQRPWMQQATIRDNIVCCEPWNPDRYDRVLHACALKPDLAVMQLGDETPVAEKGISLSGGQRQRVGLARAAYRVADVYLLDNPVSALDDQTQQHIWTHLIEGLLQTATVIVASSRPVISCTAVLKLSRNGVSRGDSAVSKYNGFVGIGTSVELPPRYLRSFPRVASSSDESCWPMSASETITGSSTLPARSRHSSMNLTMEEAAVADVSRQAHAYRRYADDIEREKNSSNKSAMSSIINFFNGSSKSSLQHRSCDEQLLPVASSSGRHLPKRHETGASPSFFDFYEKSEEGCRVPVLDIDTSGEVAKVFRASNVRVSFKRYAESQIDDPREHSAGNVTDSPKMPQKRSHGLLRWMQAGNIRIWLLVIITYPLSQGTRIACDLFLRFWSENKFDYLPQQGYLEIYSWMTAG